MTNERLRAALAQAGIEIDDLADAVQVDAKTVRRWLSGGTPYSRHRTRVAKALGVEEHELWPDAQPPTPGTSRLELIGAFAHANDVLAPDWRALLKDASERIELLDLTLLEIVSQPGVTDLLAQKAARGCRIRLLISTVDSIFLGVSEHELNPEYSPTQHPELGYEIQLARGHIEPLLGTAGIEVRKYLTMRFNTIIRCDEQMLVTLHLHGTPAREAPVIHLRQADHPGLFSSSSSTTRRSGRAPAIRSRQSPTCSPTRTPNRATTRDAGRYSTTPTTTDR
ncbi:MAG: helix-turn-helix domain-containing protein [Actinomycetota bacterium]|nr:helix-turn-helix domain-containing protein [Actinomycetota bacterium]